MVDEAFARHPRPDTLDLHKQLRHVTVRHGGNIGKSLRLTCPFHELNDEPALTGALSFSAECTERVVDTHLPTSALKVRAASVEEALRTFVLSTADLGVRVVVGSAEVRQAPFVAGVDDDANERGWEHEATKVCLKQESPALSVDQFSGCWRHTLLILATLGHFGGYCFKDGMTLCFWHHFNERSSFNGELLKKCISGVNTDHQKRYAVKQIVEESCLGSWLCCKTFHLHVD